MVAQAPLVQSLAQVLQNIWNFESELSHSERLAARLGTFRAWYAAQDGDAWLLAPSKFIGYANNSARRYLEDYDRPGGAHGTKSERVLAEWFEEVDPASPLGERLFRRLEILLAEYGRSPHADARINILRPEVALPAGGAVADSAKHARDLRSRIVADEDILGGQPRIRGTRMRVVDIVEMMADGASRRDILADFPYIADEDISAALHYAAQSAAHRLIRVA